MSMANNPVTAVPLAWSGAVMYLNANRIFELASIPTHRLRRKKSIQARAKSSLGRRATEYPKAGSRTGERGPREGIFRERGPGKPIRRGVNGVCK